MATDRKTKIEIMVAKIEAQAARIVNAGSMPPRDVRIVRAVVAAISCGFALMAEELLDEAEERRRG